MKIRNICNFHFKFTVDDYFHLHLLDPVHFDPNERQRQISKIFLLSLLALLEVINGKKCIYLNILIRVAILQLDVLVRFLI